MSYDYNEGIPSPLVQTLLIIIIGSVLIGGSIGIVVKNAFLEINDIPEVNLTFNEKQTIKDLAEPKRQLDIIVDRTIRVNQTQKCVSSKYDNYCETHDENTINLPFTYNEKQKYSVLFYNEKEVYIINENQNTNPSISYVNMQPIS